MEFINIHSAHLNSAAFKGAEPVCRATWLMLLQFCCTQENGGRISECQEWGDRRWQQICAVTLKEVRTKCELWNWDGKDLVVAFYPSKKEAEVRAKRLAGVETARRRWEPEADSSATSLPGMLDAKKLYTEGKVREGKGREGKELPPPAAIPDRGHEAPASVVPTEEEVLAWARSWPGLPGVGIPAGIPEAWVLDWFAYRTRPGQGPLGDWKREAVMRFRSDWVSRHPKAVGSAGREQKGRGPNGDHGAESETARRIRLEKAVKAAELALAEADEQVTGAWALRDSGNPAGVTLQAQAQARWHAADERLRAARLELQEVAS
jgi:hypothetical protein